MLRRLARGGAQESSRGVAQGSGFKIRIRHAQRIQGLELYRPKHTNPAPGFLAVFITIPVGPSVWKRPGPQAVRATVAEGTPEFSEWHLEDESRPKFACGLGSGGIPTHPRPTRVSSIPTIYSFADVERWVAPPARIPLELRWLQGPTSQC